MTSLNRSTSRRLKTLTQIPSVWEGDRRPMSSSPSSDLDSESQGECILWVDGSQGVVRSMDVVSPETGPEAIVRTLMRAMEHPHSPGKPARPQKIVVKDREIQFYLRGVLQDLDIAIDYVPELPLIDELFRGFTEILENQVPDLPPQYAQALHDQALALWQTAPWEFLEEQQILSIEINSADVGTLYASVMGMLGMEYGILFYRSEDSLKQFRAAVLEDDESQGSLEEAFLKQDCLFLTFESEDEMGEDEIDEDEDLADLPMSEIEPTFGNIHPLEGLRSVLYEEEALAVFVALESLICFIRDYHSQLNNEIFPSLSRSYEISLPESASETIKSLPVTVSTLPQLAAELEEMAGFDLEELETGEEDLADFPSLRDDLIPEDAFLSLGVISWEMLDSLRQGVQTHQVGEIAKVGDGLPVILIQTSRPKAKTVIENIAAAGGLKAICFNPGADPFDGDRYDLGLLQTEDDELFLFGEFLDDDPTHREARKKWNQRCKNTQGYCGLIIAKGLTGASRGNPQLRDMMALFEARSLSPQDLGIGTLQLMPQL
ncbi:MULTISPECIES: hypothetical protein [unclassified Nodularia (in: cyanobacteria)]|uniref:DUF6930 domain-containing protein n=1 Tax=unclassified Nodularia (in: cyanobacteria) TaxID=2656917 RepID=UPI001881F8CB|nr:MULTISPECIES: hypothetical protein [unclassified Nodularia (in: cyanobacteria)]MBE9201751.1 hypothetical protein [Nodularia sp. LEGE 06071]MCC2694963.1 hypothetical protein [Nodularia sp. LEGE 04288]